MEFPDRNHGYFQIGRGLKISVFIEIAGNFPIIIDSKSFDCLLNQTDKFVLIGVSSETPSQLI